MKNYLFLLLFPLLGFGQFNPIFYASASVSIDADAQAYITAATITDAGQKSAINTLFKSLKSAGVYTKIQAMYPFLGTTPTQQKWNAKDPRDLNAAYRLVFSGGGTFSNNGYQSNGTNSYADTFFIPSSIQNVNSNGITITVGTNNATTASDVLDIGSSSGATSRNLISVKNNNTTFSRISRFNSDAGGVTVNGVNESRGIFTGSKQSATVNKLFRNGSQIGSTGSGGGTLSIYAIYIGNLNISNVPYSSGWSNQRIQFTAFHEGLSDAEISTFHTIIDTFENAIGRKTW